MRLIDADRFKQQIAAITVANNLPAEKCNAMCRLIDKQPTIGDGDITPEMARAAYNVLIRYSKEHKRCNHCVFEKICDDLASCPNQWPEMEEK